MAENRGHEELVWLTAPRQEHDPTQRLSVERPEARRRTAGPRSNTRLTRN